MKIKEALTYDDVLLVPQYSDIKSRKEVDIGNNLDSNIHLSLPIISSPMDTVSEHPMAYAMAEQGGIAVIHRYNSISTQAKIIEHFHKTSPKNKVAAAVGITDDFIYRAAELAKASVDIICIDVAHGHHSLMEAAIKAIKDEVGDSIHIMAGNVATREGFEALADWGADSIRCNVGGGSICSTRIQTGHGMPGLQTIFDCASADRNVKIIADGGIRSSGDIVKALAAGADFVMLGSMLAGTDEAPGDIIFDTSGEKYKLYRGMASKEAQMEWRGKFSSNEGVSTKILYKGSVKDILKDLKNGITSGFSYSGARNIEALWLKAKWVRQTNAGLNESKTHILSR